MNNDIYYSFLEYQNKFIKIKATDKSVMGICFCSEKENEKNNEVSLRCKKELSEYLKGDRKEFTINIEFMGVTDFQRKVLEEVKKIPFGQTKSYKDIAIEIGNENSQRAVGGAVNKNPILILVPCHRVIGKNKKLVGYVSGEEMKGNLLKIEGINL